MPRNDMLVGRGRGAWVTHAAAIGLLALALGVGGAGGAGAQTDQRASSLWGAYLAADHAMAVNDLQAAAAFTEQALRRSPGDNNLLEAAYSLILQAEGVVAAVVYAERLVDQNPRATDAGLALIAHHIQLGEIEPVRALIDQLPRTGVAQFAMPFADAWVAASEGSMDRAIRALEELRSTAGFERIVDIHTALILDYMDDPAAGAAYEAVLDSGNVLAIRSAASFFARQGEPDRALAILDEATGDGEAPDAVARLRARIESGEGTHRPIDGPDHGIGESFFQLASALHTEEAYEMALAYARFADHMRPAHTPTRLLIAEAMHGAGYTDAALDAFAEIPPDSREGLAAGLRRARILVTEERHQQALEILGVLADVWPEAPEPLIQRADALRVQEAFAEAVVAYDAAADLVPALAEQDWSFLYRRGIALERSGQFERAEQDLTEAVRLNPDHGHLLNYLGYSWIDRGMNVDEAEELILRANELEPNDGYIVDSVGWVYYRTGRLEQAVEWLEEAVSLRPDDPEINDHLGDAYWVVGRRLEARFQWQRALDHAEDPEDIARIQNKLDNGLQETGILDGFEPDLGGTN